MKPTDIIVDSGKTLSQNREVAQTKAEKTALSCKANLLICLVTLLLVAGVTISGVYLGFAIKRDRTEEKVVVFRTEEGTDRERLTIYNDREGGVGVDGQYQAVIDFSRNLLFMRLLQQQHDTPCLVIPFNTSMFPSRQDFTNLFNTPQDEVAVTNKSSISITTTTLIANPNVLSKNGHVMCADQVALWALPTSSGVLSHGGIQKREGEIRVKGEILGVEVDITIRW